MGYKELRITPEARGWPKGGYASRVKTSPPSTSSHYTADVRDILESIVGTQSVYGALWITYLGLMNSN